MKSAVRDDNPVVYLEHKWIYRRIKEQVPEDPDFLVPIGKADVKREGADVSIVTYGAMVHKALEAAENLRAGASRRRSSTSAPCIRWTRRRCWSRSRRPPERWCSTSSYRFVGIGAEVAATIAEKAFEHLDAPGRAPRRRPNMPVPFSPPLEDAFLPRGRRHRAPSGRRSSQPGEEDPDDARSRCPSSARRSSRARS